MIALKFPSPRFVIDGDPGKVTPLAVSECIGLMVKDVLLSAFIKSLVSGCIFVRRLKRLTSRR